MAVVPIEIGAKAQSPSATPTALREDPRIRLAQLVRLHDEAAETALLANLLGRAPRAGAAIVVSALALVVAAQGAMPMGQVVVWLALIAAGVAALWRAYARAIAAPFELFTLKAFAGDVSAVLFYAGFAWGAGAFLALAATSSPLPLMLFAAVPCALVAGLLQSRIPTLFFLAPVAGLSVLAALVRPVGGLTAAALTLVVCAVVAGISYWLERVSAPMGMPSLVPASLR
jgi:hypothetical protein